MVPDVVIVPPDNPTPAVIEVIVPLPPPPAAQVIPVEQAAQAVKI